MAPSASRGAGSHGHTLPEGKRRREMEAKNQRKKNLETRHLSALMARNTSLTMSYDTL